MRTAHFQQFRDNQLIDTWQINIKPRAMWIEDGKGLKRSEGHNDSFVMVVTEENGLYVRQWRLEWLKDRVLIHASDMDRKFTLIRPIINGEPAYTTFNLEVESREVESILAVPMGTDKESELVSGTVFLGAMDDFLMNFPMLTHDDRWMIVNKYDLLGAIS